MSVLRTVARGTRTVTGKIGLIFTSNVWQILIGILLVPVYIRMLGSEAYGLIAFYGTLMGALAILDLGLSTALTRQIAIYNSSGSVEDVPVLIATLQTIYWVIGLAAGLAITILAPVIATHWLNIEHIDHASVVNAIRWMGLIFAIQWPAAIYIGALFGLQRQHQYAMLTLITTTLRAAGVIPFLILTVVDVPHFFIWQGLIAIGNTTLLGWFTWRGIQRPPGKIFISRAHLQTIRSFSIGMFGIALVTFLLMQLDKIIVSKMVPLTYVGYYGLAFMVASSLNQVVSVIQPIFLPRFSELNAVGDDVKLKQGFHEASRWVSIVIFPIGLFLVFFGHDILLVWTSDPVLAKATTPCLQFFTAGSMLNCMLALPYQFMLAKGQTKFTFYQNLVNACIMVPALFFLTDRYGIVGASAIWLFINAAVFIISMPIINRLYLHTSMRCWYVNDILVFAVLAGGLAASARWVMNMIHWVPGYFSLATLGVVLALAYAVLVPEIRKAWMPFFARRKRIVE